MARCKHCKSTYEPIRKGHIFCTDTCRKLSHKADIKAKSVRRNSRRITSKLNKLSSCSFGRYLLKEVRRAGTVEVLQGHTAESLNKLVELRRKCTVAGGYENGKPSGAYELSHLWPVVSDQYLGLLRVENLVIAPKEFNRRHGTKCPVKGYLGMCIPRNTLDPSWSLEDKNDNLGLLKIIRSYLGVEFDRWISGFVISLTQRDKLIKDLTKVGHSRIHLEALNLDALKAIAEQEDVSFFDINRDAADIIEVIHAEFIRLGLKSEISIALEKLIDSDDLFGDNRYTFTGTEKEKQEFESELIKQALLCLHGQRHEVTFRGRSLITFFAERTHVSRVSGPQITTGDDYDDIL